MSWRLPSLNALRAFEVAARHSSFTRAADELFVTPGAISRQVRSLEEVLGKSLFDRTYREVVLNDASRAYAAELFEAFSRIDRATRAFTARDEQPKLRIYVPMTFALRWLMPRLALYHARNPEQGVIVTSLLDPPATLQGSDVDVAVRLAGPSIGELGEKLFKVVIRPVCSPAFLESHPILRPQDLLGLPLLQSAKRPNDWKFWFDACGMADTDAELIQFNSSSMAYEAAASGLGVAIGMDRLIEDDIAAGRLVAPFADGIETGARYHIVYAAPTKADVAAQGFVRWICETSEQATPVPAPGV